MRRAHCFYLLALGLSFSFSLSAAQLQRASRAPANAAAVEPRPAPPVQRYTLGPAVQVNLGPIDDSIRDAPPPRRGLLRVAAPRTLSPTETGRGAWQKTSDGASVWRLDLRSPGAVGVRLHFTQFSVGAGQVWVHDTATPPSRVFGPYSGSGRNGDGDFWTEVIFADTVEIEYQPANGDSTSGPPPFQISELSHLWQFGRVIAPRLSAQTPAAAAATPTNFRCFLDASCYASPSSGTYVPAVGNAVRGTALIIFGDSSGTYQCTATLLNAPNTSPLLLTAGHCINTQAQALSMVAIFNAVDQSCTQAPNFTAATTVQLQQLPQTSGVQLLSFADQAFLDEGSQSEIDNDLDYSLVLLNAFPAWGDVLLSGYNATPVTRRQQLVSVSAPQGFFLKAAFSTVLPSLWANGFDVDQTTEGRIDAGSSGSGIFDSSGNLVGVLSTGSSPCSDPTRCPTLDSCDVNGEFVATYTSFSAIYTAISAYLNQPLDISGVSLPANPQVFSASPITNVNIAGYGDTTLSFNADPRVTVAEIHAGAPNGPLVYLGSGTGSDLVQGWVSEGTLFYLQNVSNNQARTLANTIATATAHRSAVTFTATPPFILFPNSSGYGSMTLNWNVPGAQATEVHVGSPAGPLFAYGGTSSWARANGWVTDGMNFVLCDVSAAPCSAQTTVGSLIAHFITDKQDAGGAGTALVVAFPNPVLAAPGELLGQTTLYWRVPGAARVEIHVGSPTGPLFAAAGPTGSATTGTWVTNGMAFFAQDVTNGSPGVTAASTAVTVIPTD